MCEYRERLPHPPEAPFHVPSKIRNAGALLPAARLGLSSRCIMNPKTRSEHRRTPTQVLPIEGLLPLA